MERRDAQIKALVANAASHTVRKHYQIHFPFMCSDASKWQTGMKHCAKNHTNFHRNIGKWNLVLVIMFFSHRS